MARTNKNSNGKSHTTQRSVDQTVWSICDILRRSGRASALQYVPELTWILFLRILDDREEQEAQESDLLNIEFKYSIEAPYRWRDWAAPGAPKRIAMQEGRTGALREFLEGNNIPPDEENHEFGLFNYLHELKNQPDATPRQKVICQVMSSVEKFNLANEFDMWEVVDKVHDIHEGAIDTTHVFPLSQVFEGLLLRMGEKNNDGGQFFTPREVIRAMVRALDPQLDKTIYDPGCGTGGFLAQSYEHLLAKNPSPQQRDDLKHATFYGREKDDLAYPVGLANLVLHGIDQPNLWHGNTLTRRVVYDGLFQNAPDQYDYILTNPPFGGKESKQAQTQFDFKTSATQCLFLQHIINTLNDDGGKCGIVLDEGLLFRTNEKAFVQTKRKLLDECNVWCIVSLPGGVFTSAGAGVKTNLVFFTKGQPTEDIWYYDLSHLKIRKKSPLTTEHFDEFFQLLPTFADSDNSWTINIEARKTKAAADAKPYQGQAQAKQQELSHLEAQLKVVKKEHGARSEEANAQSELIKAAKKELRELTNRIQSILDAVYDLKAVNPNNQPIEDTRTPAELITIIEEKSQEITKILAKLK